MEWSELIQQIAGVGGNLGLAYIICYTLVELTKICAIGIVSWKALKALAIFMKEMFEY